MVQINAWIKEETNETIQKVQNVFHLSNKNDAIDRMAEIIENCIDFSTKKLKFKYVAVNGD